MSKEFEDDKLIKHKTTELFLNAASLISYIGSTYSKEDCFVQMVHISAELLACIMASGADETRYEEILKLFSQDVLESIKNKIPTVEFLKKRG